MVPRNAYILIVETDDLIRQLLERWLGEAGYRVEARAPQRCDPSSEADVPDLVIVNVADPGDAEPVTRSLQDRYGAPVLVVSARVRRGLGRSIDAARRLGARKVLPKPFTREELLAAVEESIDVSGA